MKWFIATLAFLFMFACGFFLGGMLLMPYLPPTPARPVTLVEGAFWIDNWAGLLLGIILGALSVHATLRRYRVTGVEREAQRGH